MGKPPAPPWATILFGIHKEAVLAQLWDTLQLYCRFIDDALGIWRVDSDPDKDQQKWTAFTLLMQDYYGLECIFGERLNTVNFMDMTISIHKDRIVTYIYKNWWAYIYISSPILTIPRECQPYSCIVTSFASIHFAVTMMASTAAWNIPLTAATLATPPSAHPDHPAPSKKFGEQAQHLLNERTAAAASTDNNRTVVAKNRPAET